MKSARPFWFHDTVSAAAYSFAGAHGFSAPFNDVTRFILRQHAQMPDYLRAPMMAATLGFDLAGLPGGKPFHQQSPERRARQIAAWKNSPSGFQRDLVRYFESLATFAAFSRDDAAATPVELSEKNVITDPARELRVPVVVVGSGPGGAITACLLAEAGREVLLVEEGAFLPQSSCEPFSQEEMLQKYRNGGQTVALGRNKISYVEGRCIGGGSEINSALYHRTPPEVLEHWRQEFRVDGLSELEMRPHFEACERDVSVSPLPRAASPASLKLHDGATRLGWKSLEVSRWFRYDDAREGRRQSMTETFIPRFLRAGGKILPRTRVHRLVQDGAGWRLSARHDRKGGIRLLAGTLFLCAGAVQTPTLLRRSGITLNIGDSLQVHPTVKMVAQFPETINAAGMGVPVHQVKEFAPRLSFGCSISGAPHLALALLDHPGSGRTVADDWQRMAVYYAMITSEGRGTVRPLPGFRDPLVRYVLTEADRRNLGDGLKKLAQLLFEAGARTIYPGTAGRAALTHRDQVKSLPDVLADGAGNLMTIHLFSSCPMGEDRERCAVDSYGRVHGFKNLYVNDASLLCTAPGVNPQGSIMALARRNALRFLGTVF